MGLHYELEENKSKLKQDIAERLRQKQIKESEFEVKPQLDYTESREDPVSTKGLVIAATVMICLIILIFFLVKQ